MGGSDGCTYKINVSKLREQFTLNRRDASYSDLLPYEDLTTDDDGYWNCPRVATESDGKCVFHSESDEVTDSEIQTEIKHCINDGATQSQFVEECSKDKLKQVSKRFIGLKAGKIELEHIQLDGVDMFPIDFRGCELEKLSLTGSTIGHDIICNAGAINGLELTNASIDGSVTLHKAEIGGEIAADSSTISSRLSGVEAEIAGPISTCDARVENGVDFSYSKIETGIQAKRLYVEKEFRLKQSKIGWELNCEGLELTSKSPNRSISGFTLRNADCCGSAILNNTYIEGTVLLNELTVGGSLHLQDATVKSHVWLGGVDNEVANLKPAEVGQSLNLTGSEVGGILDCSAAENGKYSGVKVGGALHASRATFGGKLEIQPELENPEINAINLRGTTINGGTLGQPSDGTITYDLTDATIGDIEIESINRNPADHVRFNGTEFDGFRFSNQRRLYSRIDWNIHNLDPEYEQHLLQCYELLTAERLAIDFAVLFREFPSLADFVAQSEAPYKTEDIVDAVFSEHHDPEHIQRHGPENFFSSSISEREAYRRGIVTLLAEYKYKGEENRAYLLLENETSARQIQELASAVLRRENHEAPISAVISAENITQSSLKFAKLFSEEAVDTGDESPYRPDNPEIELQNSEIETTYLMARNGAKSVGDTVAAGEFLIQELRYRRKQHWQTFEEDNDQKKRLQALKDGILNATLDGVAVYGERSSRVIGVSLGLVFFFSVIYSLVWGIGLGSVQDSILFSFQSFIAFVVGSPPAGTFLVRTLSAIQGFLGAFFISMFVVTLTRSTGR